VATIVALLHSAREGRAVRLSPQPGAGGVAGASD
jgi:hypothetical protein